MSSPIVLRDWRRPGQPFRNLAIKFPAAEMETLQGWAERLQCSRSSLARTLVLQGLEQIETAIAQGVA